MRQSWWMAAVAVTMLSGSAWAQNANAAVPAEDCLVPLKSKAVIEIEGQFDLGMWVHNVEGVAPNGRGGLKKPSYNATEYATDAADLKLTVKASDAAWLTVTLDLDDAWNSNDGFEQDDFLKEMYFTFDNLWGTGFGVKAGKMAVPFGYDKDELLVSPYIDGWGESAFSRSFNSTGSINDIGGFVPYMDAHSTYTDEVFAITPYWNWNDKLLIEASLFQSARDVNGVKRRSNDNMLFKSMAAKITWKPIENLKLTASGITYYNDSARGPGLSRREKAFSVSADYTFQLAGKDFNMFAEWMHGWDNANDGGLIAAGLGLGSFMKDAKSDDIHFGVAYNFTDRLKVHAQGEYLRQKQERFAGAGSWTKQELWRAVLAVQYEMCAGIVLEGGWQHEWLTSKLRAGGNTNKISLDADTFFAGIRYSF